MESIASNLCFLALFLAVLLLCAALRRAMRELDTFRDTVNRLVLAQYDQKKKLTELEDKITEAYDTAQAQAKQEKRMFDGLNSILDYDVNAARKAVNFHGGDE